MLKKILLLITILVATLGADVKSKMEEVYTPNYEPMYQYEYHYVPIMGNFTYTPWYFQLKHEHRKVVNLLGQANRTIGDLKYEVEMLSRDVAYWKKRNDEKTSKSDKLKREAALKKMREEIRFK